MEKDKNLNKYIKSSEADIICLNELKCDEASFIKENLSSLFDDFK